MKTIKQIADEIGVSKTAVRKKLTDEVKTKFAETVSGVIFISPEGESLIKQSFEHISPQTKFAEVSANQFPQVSGEVSALISMLERELKSKEAEIERLHKVIDQEQQLRLAEKQMHLLAAAPMGATPAGAPDKKSVAGFFSHAAQYLKK